MYVIYRILKQWIELLHCMYYGKVSRPQREACVPRKFEKRAVEEWKYVGMQIQDGSLIFYFVWHLDENVTIL